MNVQNRKFKTRFIVKCEYNEDILSLIQKYEKIYCNKEELELLLPIVALQDFSNDIQNLLEIKLEITDNKPCVSLTRVDDKIELKFTTKLLNHLDLFKLGMLILAQSYCNELNEKISVA
jgi:hypothetical protein